MGMFLQSDDLIAFGASASTADKILEVVEERALMVAPCLRTTTDLGIIQSVRAILIPAALRWASNPLQVEGSEGAGPFSATLRPNGRIILTNEEDALRALCASGERSAAAGLPQGSFPVRGDYERLFAQPAPRRR